MTPNRWKHIRYYFQLDISHPVFLDPDFYHPDVSHKGRLTLRTPWASYQIRKIAGCACAGNAGNVLPATDFKGNCLLAILACITARAWRTCRDACRNRQPAMGKTFPAFPAHVQPTILRIWQEAHGHLIGAGWASGGPGHRFWHDRCQTGDQRGYRPFMCYRLCIRMIFCHTACTHEMIPMLYTSAPWQYTYIDHIDVQSWILDNIWYHRYTCMLIST